MRTRFALVCTATLALAACDQKTASEPKDKNPPLAVTTASGDSSVAAPKGFTHEEKVDISGYYLPKDEVQIGNYKLTRLFAGGQDEFRKWEKGERQPTFGPLMMEFDDVSSPVQTNEQGAPFHMVTVRVLPTAYHMTKAALAFHGQDPALGAVTFAGAFHQKALVTAKATGNSGDASVLKGDLQIGDKRFRDVAFTYFVGD